MIYASVAMQNSHRDYSSNYKLANMKMWAYMTFMFLHMGQTKAFVMHSFEWKGREINLHLRDMCMTFRTEYQTT